MRFAFPDGRSPCDLVAHLSGSRVLRGLARARTGAYAPVPATTALLHTLGNRHCTPRRPECTDACDLTTHVRSIGDTVRLEPMDPRAPTAYVFDGFRLDLARRRLTDPDGRVLPLPARAHDVLAYLVENRARVVSKDELMRAVWSRVVVEENNLNQAIYNIRKALGDSRDAPRFIVTVAGRGYQFIADIRPDRVDVAPGATSAPEAPAPAEPPMPAPAIEAATALEVTATPVAAPTPVSAPPPERLSRRSLLAAGAAALSAGGLAWWRFGAPTANSESTRLVAEARIALRSGMPAKDREAIALIERAVAIAPDDAAAWGLLALAHARAEQHAAPDLANPATALIDEAAQRALALDPANADARAAIALAIPYFGDWLAAERRFDAILADHPGHIILQDARIFLLGAVGRLRERIGAGRRRPERPLRRQHAIWPDLRALVPRPH